MNQGPRPDDAIGRSAMAKAMWRIVPLILLAYVVAYIDRFLARPAVQKGATIPARV